MSATFLVGSLGLIALRPSPTWFRFPMDVVVDGLAGIVSGPSVGLHCLMEVVAQFEKRQLTAVGLAAQWMAQVDSSRR